MPASGNLSVKGRRLVRSRPGRGHRSPCGSPTAYLRVLLAGVLVKTVASKLAASDLHALVLTGQARLLDPDNTPIETPVTGVIEVDRTVNAAGCVGLANKAVSIGFGLAGRDESCCGSPPVVM